MRSRTPARPLSRLEGGGLAMRASRLAVAHEADDDLKRICGLAFTPSRLIAASTDGVVRVVPLDRGGPVRAIRAHEGSAWSIATDAAGEQLVTAGEDGAVRCWALGSGTLERSFSAPGKRVVWIGLPPRGDRLLTLDEDGIVSGWDLRSSTPVQRAIAEGAFSCALSGDGAWLAIVNAEGVKLKPLARGRTRTIKAPDAYAAAFRGDGRWLAIACQYADSLLCDLQRDAKPRRFQASPDAAEALAFAPDGKTLAWGDRDGRLSFLPVASRGRGVHQGATLGYLLAVAWSRDGRLVAAGGLANGLTVWRARDRRPLGTLRFIADDEWLFTAPTGVFDASEGAAAGLYGVRDYEPVPYETARDAARIPGLLDNALAGRATTRTPRLVAPPVPARVAPPPAATAPALTVRTKPTHKLNALAVSPDAAVLAAGGKDMNIDLWDLATRRELRTLRGHTHTVTSLAFSRDGRWLASGARDGTVRLWDLATGIARWIVPLGFTDLGICLQFAREDRVLLAVRADGTLKALHVASGRTLYALRLPLLDYVRCVFSRDARLLAQAHGGGDVQIWDLEVGHVICRLKDGSDTPGAMLFSHDGTELFFAHATTSTFVTIGGSSGEASAPLWAFAVTGWSVKTRKRTRELLGHTANVRALALEPSGDVLISASDDHTVRHWDLGSGRTIATATTGSYAARAAVVASDGRLAVAEARAPFHGRIEVWEGRTPEASFALERHIGDVNPVVFASGGHTLVAGGEDGIVWFWDLDRWSGPRLARGHTDRIFGLAATADGELVASASWDGTARLWEVRDGKQRAALDPQAGRLNDVAIARDGRVACGASSGAVSLWSVADDAARSTLRPRRPGEVMCCAISPDGRLLARGDFDPYGGAGTIDLVNLATGRTRQRLSGHSLGIYRLAFSPDGALLASGSLDQTVKLWKASSGRLVRSLEGHAVLGGLEKGTSVDFRADGEVLASAGNDGTLRLWQVDTGRPLAVAQGHTGSIASVRFHPSGRWIACGGNDASTTLWDVEDPVKLRKLVTLYAFPDGSWAVIDADGRYDAANGGDIPWLHWVVGMEPIGLDQLKDRYYEPGLLAKAFGITQEPVRAVPPLGALDLYPAITVAPISDDGTRVSVSLVDRGGGIGRVELAINGKEVSDDARGPDAGMHFEIDIGDNAALVPGAENRCEVRAYNAAGYLVSRGVEWICRPPEQDLPPPELWAVIAGVSRYASLSLKLAFPWKDARRFALAARLAGERLFGPDRVHLRVLCTLPPGVAAPVDEPVEHPSRANLLAALDAARAAKASDVLLVYLAGHGVGHGDADYYFLTTDAASQRLDDPAVRASVAVSSADLAERLRAIPALKTVLVLDTCAAGRAVDKLAEARGVPASQVRALERLKDRTGLHVLAGAAADAPSYESSRHGQGLLTYSLLLGMRGAALRDDGYVDVAKLFGFAADTVEKLAGDLGGIQKPLTASPRAGASFDIGRLTPEDRDHIPLAPVLPLVLRATFMIADEWFDPEGVSRRINEALRDVSAQPDPPLMFIDAAEGEMSDALVFAGVYRRADGALKAQASLRRGSAVVAQIAADGGDAAALAEALVAEVVGAVAG